MNSQNFNFYLNAVSSGVNPHEEGDTRVLFDLLREHPVACFKRKRNLDNCTDFFNTSIEYLKACILDRSLVCNEPVIRIITGHLKYRDLLEEFANDQTIDFYLNDVEFRVDQYFQMNQERWRECFMKHALYERESNQ
jgi:hypothetical protein